MLGQANIRSSAVILASSFFLAGLFVLVVAAPVKAGTYDGTANLICSSIDTVECSGDGSCFQGRAEDINLPQFFRLHFDEMVVRRKTPEGNERSSKIDTLRHDAGELILQGVEEGLAWSMVIDEDVGRMTLSAASDDTAFVIFGACIVD